MTRVFWDTMLFIYLLEGDSPYRTRVKQLLRRSRERGDLFYTSHLAIGEVLAGAELSVERATGLLIREVLDEIGFFYLPFDAGAVDTFSRLRLKDKLKIADAIHLSCAASAGIDLFLTGDKNLFKVNVPGVRFISNFETAPL